MPKCNSNSNKSVISMLYRTNRHMLHNLPDRPASDINKYTYNYDNWQQLVSYYSNVCTLRESMQQPLCGDQESLS